MDGWVGEEDDDGVLLLGEEEVWEFADFDPTMNDNNMWNTGEAINVFLEKHFNREVR